MGADRIEVIYLDMDGVIADFITPSLLAADIPLKHDDVKQWNYYEPYMTAEEFWSRIAADDTFWLDIEPYPWAHELFDACKRVAPVIFCSSPCADPRCAAQKIQWLRINGFMGPDENNYILTPHKEHFAKPFRVLIDDSDKNIDNFNWHGGYGVTFPQNYNTLTQWTANRVSSVIDDLMNPPWDDPPQSALKSAPSKKEDILEEALRITGGDRQALYGPPDQDFRRTGDMWTGLFRDMLKDGVAFEPFHVAQAMILLKMSRQLHQRKRDNWTDTAGYARCGALCDEAATT